MTTTLRQVLQAFEDTTQPLSLNQMAQQLDLPSGMLEGMIMHWVRKGKIREVGGAAPCGTCSKSSGCHYMPEIPRSYELARPDDPLIVPAACNCCR